MRKRRQRTTSQTSGQRIRQVPTDGRYPYTGVPTRVQRVPRPALPEVLPRLLPDPLESMPRKLQAVPTEPVLRRVYAPKRQPGRAPAKLAGRPQRKPEVMPGLRLQRAPCDIRAEKRRAVFASGAAGKGWRRGGPWMYNSRRSQLSRYTCG